MRALGLLILPLAGVLLTACDGGETTGGGGSGGEAVFSGMLKGQESDFIARYQGLFRDFVVTQREDWIRITAVRR